MGPLVLHHHSPAEWADLVCERLLRLGCSSAYVVEARLKILERSGAEE